MDKDRFCFTIIWTPNGNNKCKLFEFMCKNWANSQEKKTDLSIGSISFLLQRAPLLRKGHGGRLCQRNGPQIRRNGDGWDSMCRAADKLSLINGFSPGHLISLALSLKSNLTLCMSVNINKPSTLHSNVIYCVAHGARQESQFDGEDGSSVCLKWGQRGEKSRQILLSIQTSINTEQV